MYNIKNTIHKEIPKEYIELIKKYKKGIVFYLTELTERKTGYLYYPIFNLRNRTIIVVNVKNNDNKYNLIKPLNEKVIVKIISIKNNEIWQAINILLRIFSCTLNEEEEYLYNDIRVFKIYDIIAYLREVKFDLTDTKLTCNVFKTVFLKNDTNGEYKSPNSKLLCYIERDITIIMILKNINRIYKTTQKANKTQCVKSIELAENDVTSIIQKLEIDLEGVEHNIYLEPKVHIVNKSLYDKIKDNITSYTLHVVKDNEYKNFTYFTKLIHSDFTLMTGYPNFKMFLNKKEKKLS